MKHAKSDLHRLWCRNLRAARLLAKKTQEEVAEELEVSQPRYAAIENGEHPPGLELMERLAPAVKAQPHELLDPDFVATAGNRPRSGRRRLAPAV